MSSFKFLLVTSLLIIPLLIKLSKNQVSLQKDVESLKNSNKEKDKKKILQALETLVSFYAKNQA